MKWNLTFDETMDSDAVWQVVSDPSVLDRICDDHWTKLPKPELMAIVDGIVKNPANYVILVQDGTDPIGAVIFYAKGNGVFEAHTMFTSRCRGMDALRMGRQITAYMLGLPEVEKLESYCPDNLPEVFLFARLVGWYATGLWPAKWLKNGIEYTMKAVACSRPDVKGIPCH